MTRKERGSSCRCEGPRGRFEERELVGKEPAADFPAGIIESEARGDFMEGPMPVTSTRK
ncbi:MAG TPA: hypothetical protein VFG09_09375 [Thermodesulfovibrionales bacterium]|nr:hypothetical protein [Thermodesulfovibrionales bacterium]